MSPKYLQDLISRSPIPGKLDYVQESLTQEVYFPADMQLHCKPEPYEYRVCLRTIRIAEDIIDDPHFSGYMQVVAAQHQILNGKQTLALEGQALIVSRK